MSRVSAQKLLCRFIGTHLRDPVARLSAQRHVWLIQGQMEVEGKYARLDIRFYREFKVLKYLPPEVRCEEPWIRRELDWHAYPDGGLCWILPRLWAEHQARPGKSNKLIAVDGGALLLESVHLLLCRHLLGHLKGIAKWPGEWDQWRHGREGIEEYERQRRLGTL